MSSRTWRLAAVAATAAIAVTAAIVMSTAASSAPPKATVTAAASGLLAGIPEHDGVLGDPRAPLTLTEFVDPQCPVCAAASKQILPGLIRDAVRTGKVKLDARVLHFLGPDSGTAAKFAAGARAQSKLWPFLETLYASQGPENSGYVTPAFLAGVARAAGVDSGAAARYAATPAAAGALTGADGEATQLGVTGTPTFVLTRADGSRAIVPVDRLDQALGL
jgi:protein-disulfide isomerase